MEGRCDGRRTRVSVLQGRVNESRRVEVQNKQKERVFFSACSSTARQLGTGTAAAESLCGCRGSREVRVSIEVIYGRSWKSSLAPAVPARGEPIRVEEVSCSSATTCLWTLLGCDVIPGYSRDQPSRELPRQPRWHQAAMQKGSPAPSDTGVTVPRKHIDIKH